MNMQKILLMLMAVLIVLLGGCADNSKTQSSSEPSSKVESTPEPVEYKEFSWPKSEAAAPLPVPESNIGHVEIDSSDWFLVDIINTSKEQYDTYVESCMEAGFTVDYSKYSTSFMAEHEDGHELHLFYYEDESRMNLSVTFFESDRKEISSATPEPTSTPKPTSTPAPESSKPESSAPESQPAPAGGIRPEFKEAMDSYEAFYQEYAEFMKEYLESEDTLGMLGKYSEYMSKLADMTEKWDKLGDEEMNDEEMKYYLDVQTRVSKLLIDIANY